MTAPPPRNADARRQPGGSAANTNSDTTEPTQTLCARKGPTVAVMRSRFPNAWPGHAEGERIYNVPLAIALTREWTTDAHLVQYRSPNARRLGSDAVNHFPIELTVIVFDIDCDAVHGTTEPAPDSWRAEMRERFNVLHAAHPNGFGYDTRGGCRLVFAQAEPTILRSTEDARRWRQDYTVACAYLERRFDIVADPACSDWPRLFRCPSVVRDGRRERRDTFGDPRNVGALRIDATGADVERATEINPRAFNERRVQDFAPCSSDGYGLLYHALHARGDVGRKRGDNAFVIRCPRESDHSCGSTGDGSTLLYLPARGERVGMIHCLHASHVGMTARDWVRCFERHELEAAERAAGFTRAA